MRKKSESGSRPVQSSQQWLHAKLPGVVQRHLASDWRKPPRDVDTPALQILESTLEQYPGPVVLDSFCGTGHSTLALAHRHPKALVIGVDKSAARLSRRPQGGEPANCLLLQANCEAVWRQLAERGRRLQAHYLLYPNPWPKPGHLSRRVHGHPAFPLLLALGGTLELRSNWQLYVEEFGVALQLAGICAAVSQLATPEEPLTLFERKYRDSEHTLWRLRAELKARHDTPQ